MLLIDAEIVIYIRCYTPFVIRESAATHTGNLNVKFRKGKKVNEKLRCNEK